MKDNELMKTTDLLTLKELAVSEEKIPVLKKRTETATIRAPNILNAIRLEETAKGSRTRQESMILATRMITCLLNELNRIAAVSPQEADDFIEKAKSSLDIIASSRMRSRLPEQTKGPEDERQ